MNIVLANSDYRNHMTNEGDQLQEGLRLSGWKLCGYGYDGMTDVRKILNKYYPEDVFVQDVRDWHRDSPGCFDSRVSYTNYECLKYSIGVAKDCGSVIDFQREMFERMHVTTLVHYYHYDSIIRYMPFLKDYKLVRTYHTVDRDRVPEVKDRRKKCIVSGAVSNVYPLRQRVIDHNDELNFDILSHPGYGNGGTHTDEYLKILSGYRVSICTSSIYGFALRKIIESIACGCTVITDLPEYDVLPGIDKYLVRIDPSIQLKYLKELVDREYRRWDIERAREVAAMCKERYDYRVQGAMLSDQL